MANYFVDFSLSSNGDGSDTTPWNQFTSTEAGSVSDGDYIWFRRYETAVNQKLVYWKAGTSSMIHYVGWPLENDTEYYDLRPSSKRSEWDDDSYQYLKQDRNSSSVPTATLVDNIKINRFYIYNSYTAQSSNTAVKIDTKSNIIFYNSVIHGREVTNNGTSVATLYINKGSNIIFNNTSIKCLDNQSITAYPKLFRFVNSTIYMYKCSIIIGDYTNTSLYLISPSRLTSTYSSVIDTSSVTISGCNFDIGILQTTNTAYDTNYKYYSYIASINSNVVMYDTTVETSNTTYNTSYVWPENAVISLVHTDSDISMYNTKVSFKQSYSSLVSGEDTYITISGCEYNTYSTEACMLAISTGDYGLNITSVSGTITNKDVNKMLKYNYVAAVENVNNLDTNYEFKDINLSGDHGGILQLHSATPITTLALDSTNIGTVITLSETTNIHITNSNVHTLKLIPNMPNNVNSNWLYFNNTGMYNVTFVDSTITGPAVSVYSDTNSVIYTLTAVGNKGSGGTNLTSNNGSYTTALVRSIRNKGFNGDGDFSTVAYADVYSSLNEHNNGNTSYTTSLEYAVTSPIHRDNGAGYSVKLTPSNITNLRTYIVYPTYTEETMWINMDTAGDYTVKTYITYKCSSCSSTSNADFTAQINYLEGNTPAVNNSTSTSSDTSTWVGITGTTGIVITNSITITEPQYASVRVVINSTETGLEAYIDPKIEVTKV